MLRLARTALRQAATHSVRAARTAIIRSSILPRAAPAVSCCCSIACPSRALSIAAASSASSAATATTSVDFTDAPSCSAMPDPIRTHTCGNLASSAATDSDAATPLILAGWLQSSRSLSDSLWFGLLRDHTGLLQITLDRGALSSSLSSAELDALFATVKSLSLESVVRVSGQLRPRPAGQHNADQGSNGSIELLLSSLTVLNRASTQLPGGLSLESDASVPPAGFPPTPLAALSHDESKLTYRYLELRRPFNQHLLRLRSQIASAVRSSLSALDFTEVETPLLFKSTPEGADEFLVPSRTPGRFYALPQSPQQHKQLLMVAGLSRYFQIARCFRDEGSRADRQPEFTQIDLEMSFVASREQVMHAVETMWQTVLHQTLGPHAGAGPDTTRLPSFPLRRMSYAQAMGQYGVDKPDTRYDLRLCDISAIVAASLPQAPCVPFATALASSGGSIHALRVPGLAGKLSRKDLDAWQKELGPSVLLVRVSKDGELKTPAMFHSLFAMPAFRTSLAATLLGEANSSNSGSSAFHTDDLLLVVASAVPGVSAATLGRARIASAHALVSHGLLRLSARQLDQCFWVVDFPLFDAGEAPKGEAVTMKSIGLTAMHHPFTAPVPEDLPRLLQLLLELTAVARESSLPLREVPLSPSQLSTLRSLRGAHYDLVCNGVELGGGSVRLHDAALQRSVLQMLGAPLPVFTHLLTALSTGAPPHGGLALGMDRVVALVGAAEQERWNAGWMQTQAQQQTQQPRAGSKAKVASPASPASPAVPLSYGLSLPIRDVIAFAKTTSGRDLMIDAPSAVDPAALKQYHIQTIGSTAAASEQTKRTEATATATAAVAK